MIKLILISSLFLSFVASANNPLFWGADPSAIVAQDGRIFIYPTNDKKKWDDQKDWHVWSSSDLENWTDHGVIFDTTASKWGIDNAWAPDIAYKDGWYYFYYYFQNGKNIQGGIGVAKSQNPEGPFTEVHGKMLVKGHDPALFMDEDGTAYMYLQDKVHVLNPDMVTLKNQKAIDIKLDYRPTKFEAAYAFKRKGIYYFTIARDWNNLIYYTSDSPLGPFKYQGDFMRPYGGNNHHSIIEYEGNWIIFYHEWAPTESDKHNRRVRADYLHFNEDGTIKQVEITERGIWKKK